MYAVMDTKGQDTTTTSNVYDLHSATVVNTHNTAPKTKAERNAEIQHALCVILLVTDN
jgi:hypothetical protein